MYVEIQNKSMCEYSRGFTTNKWGGDDDSKQMQKCKKTIKETIFLSAKGLKCLGCPQIVGCKNCVTIKGGGEVKTCEGLVRFKRL